MSAQPDDISQFLNSQHPADLGDAYADSFGVPREHIRAIMGTEGSGAGATSPKGAYGKMQLMPGTAKGLGVDPRIMHQNIAGGVAYYKQQLDRFGDPVQAAAAYNAGPGAVQKYHGVPPYRETQGYAKRFTALDKPVVRDDVGEFLQGQQSAPADDVGHFLAQQAPRAAPQAAPPAPAFHPNSRLPGGGWTDVTGQPPQRRLAPADQAQQTQLAQLFQNAHDAGDTDAMRSLGRELQKRGWEYGETTPGWPYIKPPANFQAAPGVDATASLRAATRPTRPPMTGLQATLEGIAEANPTYRGLIGAIGGAGKGAGEFIAGIPNIAAGPTQPFLAPQIQQAIEQNPVSRALTKGGRALAGKGEEVGKVAGEGLLPDIARGAGEMLPALATGPLGIPAMAVETYAQRRGAGASPLEAGISAGTQAAGLGLGGKIAGKLGGSYLSKLLGYTVGPQAVSEIEEGIRTGKLPDPKQVGERALKNAIFAAGFSAMGHGKAEAPEAAPERPQAQPEPARGTVDAREAEASAREAAIRQTQEYKDAEAETARLLAASRANPPEITGTRQGPNPVTGTKQDIVEGHRAMGEAFDRQRAEPSHADTMAQGSVNSLSEARNIAFRAENGRDPTPDEIANFGHDQTVAARQVQHDAINKSIANPDVKRIKIIAGSPGEGKSTYIEAQPADSHDNTVYYETHFEDPNEVKRIISDAKAAGKDVEVVGVLRGGGPIESYKKVVERADETGKIVSPEYGADLTRSFYGNFPDIANYAREQGVPVRGTQLEGDQTRTLTGKVKMPELPADLEDQYRGLAKESKYADQFLSQGRPGGQPGLEPGPRAVGQAPEQVPQAGPQGTEAIPQAPRQGTQEAPQGPRGIAAAMGGGAQRSLPTTLQEHGLAGGENQTYDPISNPESLAKAQQNIRDKGIDGAAEMVRANKEPSAEHTATGLAVIKAYSDAGQHQQAIDMASDLSEQLTKHGQAIQAVQVLNQLAPERVLMAAKKIADRNGVEFKAEDGARVTKLATDVQAKEAARTQAEKAVSDIVNAPTKAKIPVRVRTMADWKTSLKQGADEAFEELKRLGVTERGSGLSTDQIRLAAKWGAYKLAEKGITLAEWTQHMIDTFGEKIREQLPALRQAAYAEYKRVKDESAMAQAQTPEGKRTALQDIRQEILEGQAQERAANKARQQSVKFEQQSGDAAARMQAGIAREDARQAADQQAQEARQRVRDARARQQQIEDFDKRRLAEESAAAKQAQARAAKWDQPIHDAASAAYGKPKTARTVDDLVDIGADKFLTGTTKGKFYREMSQEHGNLFDDNKEEIYQRAYGKQYDARQAAQQLRDVRAATGGQYGAMTEDQVQQALLDRASAQRASRYAKFAMAKEFARLNGNQGLRDLDAVMKADMLFSMSPYSHKVGSLAGQAVLGEATRAVQAPIDAIWSFARGGERSATMDPAGFVRAVGTALTRGTREAGQMLKRGYSDSGIENKLKGTAEEHMDVRAERKGVASVFNPIINGAGYVFRGYKAGAHVFGTFAYERAMHEQAHTMAVNEAKQGLIDSGDIGTRTSEILVGKNLSPNAKANMEANGLQAYAEGTFQQDNFLNKKLNQFKQGSAPWTFTMNRLVPFMKSASNALSTTLDYAGVGAHSAIPETIRYARGTAGQAEFAKAWAKAPIGLSLMALGGVLHRQGKMSSLLYHKDDNPQPGSVSLGGKLVNIARYSPMGLLMGIGATMDDLWMQGQGKAQRGQEPTSWPDAIIGGFSKTASDLPLLQNLGKVYESMEAGQGKTSGVKDLAIGMAAPIIPGYGTVRDIYKGNEQKIRSASSTVNKIAEATGAAPLERVRPDIGYVGKTLGVRNQPALGPDRATYKSYIPAPIQSITFAPGERKQFLSAQVRSTVTRGRDAELKDAYGQLTNRPEYPALTTEQKQAAIKATMTAIDKGYMSKVKLRMKPNHDLADKWTDEADYDVGDIIDKAIDRAQEKQAVNQ